MGNKVSLEEEMINLRIVSKQMQRSSKKCEKNEKQALEKLKKVSKDSLYLFLRRCFYKCAAYCIKTHPLPLTLS